MDRYPEIRPFLAEARGIVVVCDSDQCPTGNLIVEWLGQMHYPGAKLLAGGWAAYEAAGLPVEATQP
jgi:3-mercaptopyruvate sulfurtransferase SseA